MWPHTRTHLLWWYCLIYCSNFYQYHTIVKSIAILYFPLSVILPLILFLFQADEDCSQSQSEFPLREGYIRYGSIVRLICTATGVALPPLVQLNCLLDWEPQICLILGEIAGISCTLFCQQDFVMIASPFLSSPLMTDLPSVPCFSLSISFKKSHNLRVRQKVHVRHIESFVIVESSHGQADSLGSSVWPWRNNRSEPIEIDIWQFGATPAHLPRWTDEWMCEHFSWKMKDFCHLPWV